MNKSNTRPYINAAVSSATMRNWQKLNPQMEGRLTHRANKRKSTKRVLPLEYVSDTNNIQFLTRVLDDIDDMKYSIASVVLSLGLNLLKRAGISERAHVKRALESYSDTSIISSYVNSEIPLNEFDILGLIYQSYMCEGVKNTTGSYYTPPKVARNITRDLDFTRGQTLLDPCCGSGAFLLSVDVNDPNQLFGVDNDPVAVMIAKINLLLKYSKCAFQPDIHCLNYLEQVDLFTQTGVFTRQFDYITTNPPWGAMDIAPISDSAISSGESFSYFFVRAFSQLKPNGIIRFLFPESILNVKAHKDIREFMLRNCRILSITSYIDLFEGVTTKYVDIECQRADSREYFSLHTSAGARVVSLASVYETENAVFNLLDDTDIDILKNVKSQGKYSLRDSAWALGIVTGDNEGKLKSDMRPGFEQIYTGKEISAYLLKPVKKYIMYDRAFLQQVAKDEMYRAPEKLVYKFISKKLVFAYDDTRSLFLNSANILIPRIPGMSIKTVMAFLNSELFQFMYIKLFGEVKVLKGNLFELPFPSISNELNMKLTGLVDSVLSGNNSAHNSIQTILYDYYGLSESQIAYIRRAVNRTSA